MKIIIKTAHQLLTTIPSVELQREKSVALKVFNFSSSIGRRELTVQMCMAQLEDQMARKSLKKF
jgi:hypothetical protein